VSHFPTDTSGRPKAQVKFAPPGPEEHSQKRVLQGDLPSRFLHALKSAEDGEILREFLLSGYYRVQSLEDHLGDHGMVADARSFLKYCSYKTYYRLFPPLHPHHPKSYHDQRLIPRNVDPLTMIRIELFALDNVADNTVKTGFRISAEWEPALWELRSWKSKDSPDDGSPQKQVSY
jgi:hypothetical protein